MYIHFARGLLLVLASLILALPAAAQALLVPRAAAFVSQDVPAAMTVGQRYNVSVTMRNMGRSPWPVGSQFFLGSQNPGDNTTWGGRIPVAVHAATGQHATFNFTVTAPSAPGTYNFQWKMLLEGVQWFGDLTPNVAVVVSPPLPVNGAALVTQAFPSSVKAGEAFTASITMRNTGNTTWTSASEYKLGSQNPTDNSTWGGGRVLLNASVAPGQEHTFVLHLRAPATPGDYAIQWRMLREFVEWFGAQSNNQVIQVLSPTPAPVITVARVPAVLVAGQAFTLNWSASNTTSLNYGCVTAGTGFAHSLSLAASGSTPATALAAWVGNPSSCTWTATGPGGTTSFVESVSTRAALTAGTKITFFHNDIAGTPLAATDPEGKLLWKENYRPFGEKIQRPPASNSNAIGFHGKQFDDVTGLSYMTARYYNPVLGRFMGIDPLEVDFADIHSFNRYAYANNNPYKFADPDGRRSQWIKLLLEVGKGSGKAAAKSGARGAKDAGKDAGKDAAKQEAKAESSNAARREVMRKEGIPTSQAPKSQSKNESGREYSYEVPKKSGQGGGTETKSVQQQTMDRSHQNEPHWEAGKVKTDAAGQTRVNDYGRPALKNGKSKVNY